MEMDILVAAGKFDLSGIWCLMSIVWLIAVIILYAIFGTLGGSLCCCVIALGFLIGASDPDPVSGTGASSNETVKEPDGVTRTANGGIITNRNKTKYIGKYNYRRDEGIYFIDNWSGDREPDHYFIPAKEMHIEEGGSGWLMNSTGKPPSDDFDEHYYIQNVTVSQYNVPVEHGGEGLSTGVYHPASGIWIFLLGGLPGIGGGAVLKRVIG